MNAKQKLKYLINAGGVRCAGENYTRMPALGRIPAGEGGSVPEQGGSFVVPGKDGLVKVRMPDSSMQPLLHPGEELTIAVREYPEDGDLAAVVLPGSGEPFTIREIAFDDPEIWMLPRNMRFPAECCDPDEAVILGKLVAHSRDFAPWRTAAVRA